MAPPRPPVDKPLCKLSHPLLPALVPPVVKEISPDTPLPLTAAVPKDTDPDPDAKLDPLVTTTEPPRVLDRV